jgi:hypothetical protein
LLLNPLPSNVFEVAVALSCRVDSKARICVRQSYYSVPSRLMGRQVSARLGAATVTAWVDGVQVASHVRSLHKGSEDLVLDHYLEVLARKPGALAGASALAGARAAGTFTSVHQQFWDGARRRLGDGPGTRALIGVLLLHRTMDAGAVHAGMQAAVRMDSYDPDLVAVEARLATTPPVAAALPAPEYAGQGPERATPTLHGYDALLVAVTDTPDIPDIPDEVAAEAGFAEVAGGTLLVAPVGVPA